MEKVILDKSGENAMVGENIEEEVGTEDYEDFEGEESEEEEEEEEEEQVGSGPMGCSSSEEREITRLHAQIAKEDQALLDRIEKEKKQEAKLEKDKADRAIEEAAREKEKADRAKRESAATDGVKTAGTGTAEEAVSKKGGKRTLKKKNKRKGTPDANAEDGMEATGTKKAKVACGADKDKTHPAKAGDDKANGGDGTDKDKKHPAKTKHDNVDGGDGADKNKTHPEKKADDDKDGGEKQPAFPHLQGIMFLGKIFGSGGFALCVRILALCWSPCICTFIWRLLWFLLFRRCAYRIFSP